LLGCRFAHAWRAPVYPTMLPIIQNDLSSPFKQGRRRLMLSDRYSPFGKALAELEAADLGVLRDVAEGWYVEYKRDWPGVKSAAKSISAFANTYGGWLFYGIQQNADRKAADFPGLDTSELPKIEQQIAQAVSAHVHPSPHFELRSLAGPEQTIGLASDRSIVVVRIPDGLDPPYVRSDGRIYRRVGDQSDPIPETDRHSLDKLWQRGREFRSEIEAMLDHSITLTEGEKNKTYIELFLLPDLFKQSDHMSRFDLSSFAKLMSNGDAVSGGIPFDSFRSTATGWMARQIKNNDPGALGFSWCYTLDGGSIIMLPVNSCSIEDIHGPFLEGYNNRVFFLQLCREIGLRSGILIDLSHAYAIISSVILRLRNLTDFDGFLPPYHWKAKIRNTSRRIPFMDLASYRSFLETYSVPVLFEDEYLAPPGKAPDSFGIIKAQLWETDAQTAALMDATMVFALICNVLGLTWNVFDREVSDEDARDLTEMGNRAMKVQEGRRLHLQ
jgi:hypothetical protein